MSATVFGPSFPQHPYTGVPDAINMAPTQKSANKRKNTVLGMDRKEYDRLRYQKMKDDPAKALMLKEKEREKYKRKKEKGQVKSISEMSERNKRAKRKQWRRNSLAYLQRKRQGNSAFQNLPDTPKLKNISTHQASSGRKKVNRDRCKLFRENVKLKCENRVFKRRIEKLRKKVYRFENKKNDLLTSPRVIVKKLMAENNKDVIKKRLLFGEVLQKQLSNSMKQVKGAKTRRYVANILFGDRKLVRKYNLLHKCNFLSSRILRRPIQHKFNNHTQNRISRKISCAVISDVRKFFEDEENSRCCPGKKDCITRKGVKMQKRMLLADLIDLHKKFNSSSPYKLSLTSFCRLRPFWILKPNVSRRETCQCQIHENFNFLLKGLYKAKVIMSSTTKSLIAELCCVPHTEKCLRRLCTLCRTKSISFSQNLDESIKIVYDEWTRKKVVYVDPRTKTEKITFRVLKQLVEKPLGEITKKFSKRILNKFLEHEGNIMHQHAAIRFLKTTLSEGELLIHCDFSENYNLKYSTEIQAMHFGGNRQSLSLHTVAVYHRKTSLSGPTLNSFCTVSENLEHSAPAVWAHLMPIFQFIKEKLVQVVSAIHFLSDGPSSQYKNKTMFYLFQNKLREEFPHLKNATWNYHETAHGKGEPDGIGGKLKSTADRMVAQGTDINDAKKFVEHLNYKIRSIKIIELERAAIDKVIQSIPKNIVPFKGTMRVHQVSWLKGEDDLHMNELSCFSCTRNCPKQMIGSHVSWHDANLYDKSTLVNNVVAEVPQQPDPHVVDIEDFSSVQRELSERTGLNNSECPFLLSVTELDTQQFEPQNFVNFDTGDLNYTLQGGETNPTDCSHRPQTEEYNEPVSISSFGDNASKTTTVYWHSGLCFKCGGSLTTRRPGIRCDICEKRAQHTECTSSILPQDPSNDSEKLFFFCCDYCDKTAQDFMLPVFF